MQQTSQYLHLKGLLNNEQLELIDDLLEQANFVDGKLTASLKAKEVKQNMQIDTNDFNVLPKLQNIVMQALNARSEFHTSLLPKAVYPPLFSKYVETNTYGWHTDGPIMGQPPLRTDIGMTLFLSDPDSYEGGELEVQSPSGLVQYKLPKGDAIFYPTTQIHRVAPVMSGTRRVCVTWIQSAVREPQNREILSTLNHVHANMIQKDINDPNAEQILQVFSNLMRKWAEL